MPEPEWIRHQEKIKMPSELKKEHWLKAKQDNENLILQSTMQIEMAKKILELIEDKLAEFPEERQKA